MTLLSFVPSSMTSAVNVIEYLGIKVMCASLDGGICPVRTLLTTTGTGKLSGCGHAGKTPHANGRGLDHGRKRQC